MPKIEKTITIHAPVEKVFAYWTDPAKVPEFWPSVVEVKDVQKLPNGGNSFRWVYKMAGMRFEGSSEDVEFVPNQRTVTEGRGGIENTMRVTFEPEDGGTKLTFGIEYHVPVPLLGKLAEAAIVKLNQNEIQLMLANWKAMMES
jgi:uncharacterized protein YndB with AHSA1/START domain